MTSTPDNRFRDHLEHFKKSPPPQAWSRIDSGLKNKNSNRIWLSAAAAIIILMSASFLLWRANEIQINTPVVASEYKSIIENKPETSDSPTISEHISSPDIKPVVSSIEQSETTKSKNKKYTASQEEMITTAEITIETPIEKSVPHQMTEEINSTLAPEPVVTNEITSAKSYNSKIIYSSGEVNSRFLKKDTSTAVPATEKSPSGIQKLLDIASSLKYDETALGDLREMKNEILSFPHKEPTKEKL